MAKKILVNAELPGETRVAIVEGGVLEEFYITSETLTQNRGNIFKGVIVRIEPALQAAFVDCGLHRNGFLQLADIHPDYFIQQIDSDKKIDDYSIKDLLKVGQEILVQVNKEESEHKGAALTTYLSLPGRYVVLTLGREIKGVSRKIEEEAERKRLKKIVEELAIPANMGVIIRTAGAGQRKNTIQKDLQYMLRLWEDIKKKAKEHDAPYMVFREQDPALKAIRDHFSPQVKEIWIDSKDLYYRAREFMKIISPRHQRRIKYYRNQIPIFTKYHLEEQIEQLFKSKVALKSGGFIIINRTEALTAIDVNSGKSIREADFEATAFKTNMEAAKEIAHQIRLRDIGGLIVIDFIDMKDKKHKKELTKYFRQELKKDRARISLTGLSRFSLIEMSRQRMGYSDPLDLTTVCPFCEGEGYLRSIEIRSNRVLRNILPRLTREDITHIKVIVPVDIAHYILNKKREILSTFEQKYNITIEIEGNSSLNSTQFDTIYKK